MSREEFQKNSNLIVVKVGSSLLVREGALQLEKIKELACNIAYLRERGKKIILVSSGAVACGMSVMGLSRKRGDIPFKQAMSAIGQSVLMQTYREVFSPLGIQVAQILLAPEDTNNRVKYLNARNTFEALLHLGVLPVVNENDSVAVAEIKFGDNDRLSALVASLIDADLLVILSDVEGLFTADPRVLPQASLIEEVKKIDLEIEEMAGGEGNYFSTGGMKSKIIAARMATLSGTGVIIASGKDFSVLQEIGEGKKRGTFFWPEEKHLPGRKRWIAFAMMPRGSVLIDKGAKKAILTQKSLLPAGVKAVEGNFDLGDCVEILGPARELVGRGITNYSSEELKKILGLHTEEVKEVLGGKDFDEEVVHADNLVLLGGDWCGRKGERYRPEN